MNLLFFFLFSTNVWAAQIDHYRVVHEQCSTGSKQLVALRSFKLNQISNYFAVDTATLETYVLPQAQLKCVIESNAQPSRYENLLNEVPKTTKILQNEGLERDTQTSRVYLTFDLCPSEKPLEIELMNFLKTVRKDGLGRPMPVGISISGGWMTNHQKDLAELEQIEKDGDVQITWINHTRHHPFVKGLDNDHNFLLEKGVDPLHEILDQEVFMLEQNIKPSIFMRFPGLVTDDQQLELLMSIGIIPVGAQSWIAKTRTFAVGDIVLIHGNGNEPAGIRLFFNFINGKWLDFDWSSLEDWAL